MTCTNLIPFKEKFNIPDYFTGVVESLLDKLVELEYISSFKINYYANNLLNNVNTLSIDKDNPYDYKSGYYDAIKKELYIKDTKNIPATYLRLLYALITIQTDENIFNTGYATTESILKDNSVIHKYFAINRAITSNLVYELCGMIPHSLKINEVKPSYTHNFLGFKIESQNDMYYLEAKLLNELCYILDLDIELLYHGLFAKQPIKILETAFKKKKFTRSEEFLKLFDKISRNYSTYNKMLFLKSKLVEETNDTEMLNKEIYTLLSNLNNTEIDNSNYNILLNDTIIKFQNELKNNIIAIQDILAEQLIESSKRLPYAKYACKLKCFNNILIVPNERLNKIINQLIVNKLMELPENVDLDTTQKIRYALINEILSTKNHVDISNKFSYYNIIPFENKCSGTYLLILHSDKLNVQILEITGINNNDYHYTTTHIPLDSLKNINYYKNLYELLKNKFSNISLEDIYCFKYNSKKILLTICENKPYILCCSEGTTNNLEELTLSKCYKVFGSNSTNK